MNLITMTHHIALLKCKKCLTAIFILRNRKTEEDIRTAIRAYQDAFHLIPYSSVIIITTLSQSHTHSSFPQNTHTHTHTQETTR